MNSKFISMTISPNVRHFRFISFLALASVFAPQLLLAQAFEGEITMRMSSPMLGEQKIEMVSTVKGDNILQTADDPKQGKINIYTNTKTGTQIIVMEAQKQGMQFEKAAIDSAIKGMHMPAFVPKATGKTQKIGNFNAELYTMDVDTAQKQEMDMWLTKDYPKDVSNSISNCIEAGMKTTGVQSDAFMSLFKGGLAPVRIEMKMGGVTQLTNEFVKFERKKIDSSIFIVASDIKVNVFDPAAMQGGPPPEGGK